MDKDRIVGEGRNVVGKGKELLGEAVGDKSLESEGAVDRAAGAIQHGYGVAKDAVGDVASDARDLLPNAADRVRDIGRQGEEAIRNRLGDNGPIYVLAGAVALLAVGVFALSRRN